MTVDLPAEILLLIFDFVEDAKDISSLLALCLVNHRFADIARRYIYSDVNRYDRNQPSSARLLRLHLTLSRSSHLRSLVRKIQPLPNMYRARWRMSAMLRLIARNLRSMPNLVELDYYATAPFLRCGPIRELPASLDSLSVFAFLDEDTLHAINEQAGIRKLSILDMAPPQNELAIIPHLDQLINPSTLPNLEELVAPFEFAVRLLPDRSVRRLSVPSALEDVSASHLARAINTSRAPLRYLHLHTYSFDVLYSTLPPILAATPELLGLSLDFIEIRNQLTLEQLGSPPGLALFTAVPHLRKLFLRFTFRSQLLQEEHQDFLEHLRSVCPGLEEVILSSMLRGESVTYQRRKWLPGDEESRWEKTKVMVQNTAAFYAAHG